MADEICRLYRFRSVRGSRRCFIQLFLRSCCPPQVDIKTATMAILMLIVGGSSIFFGPVLGAILFVLLEYFASIYLPTRWPLVLGLVFIFSVMFLRGGIAVYFIELWKDRIRRNESGSM